MLGLFGRSVEPAPDPSPYALEAGSPCRQLFANYAKGSRIGALTIARIEETIGQGLILRLSGGHEQRAFIVADVPPRIAKRGFAEDCSEFALAVVTRAPDWIELVGEGLLAPPSRSYPVFTCFDADRTIFGYQITLPAPVGASRPTILAQVDAALRTLEFEADDLDAVLAEARRTARSVRHRLGRTFRRAKEPVGAILYQEWPNLLGAVLEDS